MAKTRCSVFDEGLDAQCACSASMVRTVIKDGEFPTCAYYCKEHNNAHSTMAIEVALKIQRLRDRALRSKDEHRVNACDRALFGDELTIDECVNAITQADAG